MIKDPPKELLNSKYRKEMWNNSKKIINRLEKVLPISSVHVHGSFSTRKKRPNDVDFIVLLNIKEKDQKSKWSVDMVIAPENRFGKNVLKDTDKYRELRYLYCIETQFAI